jgi:hypothetical protein
MLQDWIASPIKLRIPANDALFPTMWIYPIAFGVEWLSRWKKISIENKQDDMKLSVRTSMSLIL